MSQLNFGQNLRSDEKTLIPGLADYFCTMIDWVEWGYWGLFAAAFLAATILPFSSDAVLAAMMFGDFDPVLLVAYASLGNWLGGMSSYALGMLGKWTWIEKYLRVKKREVIRWKILSKKYGAYFALLTWLPLIGDVMAIGLGFARTKLVPTAIFMFIGKAARYIAIAWLFY